MTRQPVHTVYGGAHLFKAGICRKLGDLAEASLNKHAPDARSLAKVLGIAPEIEHDIYARLVDKLRSEPVEDFRIDFEDGFGVRSDEEEDAAIDAAVLEVAEALAEGTLPPFFGFRIKALNDASKARAVRTLRRFLSTLLLKTKGRLPENFIVTLPKVSSPQQVSTLVDALKAFGNMFVEIMVETPASIFRLPELVQAARGRCIAAHFGAYDYTASLGITAAHQHLRHPACEFARSTMLASLAGSGICLADGATNILPLPDNPAAVHRGWKLHYDNVRHSLYNGFYQSWDLHPPQLPARYAAVYAFYLEGLAQASDRLKNFIAEGARATQYGGVFDDAATGQGLVNFFLRAVHCGAIPEGDVQPLTGLTVEELQKSIGQG